METIPAVQAAPQTPPTHRRRARLPRHAKRAGLALVVTLAVADWLLFDRFPGGVALAMLGMTAFAAAWAARPRPWRRTAAPLLLASLAMLPMIEHLQALSFGIGFFGLLVSLAWLQARPGDWLILLGQIPIAAPRDAIRAGRAAGNVRALAAPSLGALLTGWALPLVGAAVLVALLTQANPVLDGLFDLDWSALDAFELYWRSWFWGAMALLLWPLILGLAGRKPRSTTLRKFDLPGINPASVARALWVFNGLLAVQTVTDAGILWGGASLPEGMSYASYAHRGAYPLLATALLAIAFSIVARPHLDRPVMRWLLILWLVQNLALTASAGLRLSIYVDAFGLTYLRLHAAVWMAVVALGIALALWQVARDRSTEWLVLRGAVLAGATLYLCAFVNFSAIIANHTVARYASGQEIDVGYLCRLPDTASAAILSGQSHPDCRAATPNVRGWRDWGFREARVRSKLAAMKGAAK